MINLSLALFLSAGIASAAAAPMRNLLVCTLEDGSEVTLQAQHDPEHYGDRFFVTIDGKTETAFTDFPDNEFSGDIVLSNCVHHVMIFAIEYGPPYRKGVVIRRPAGSRVAHRIDFSEKALPELLYLGKRETKLVIPNVGYEVPSKYLLYRYTPGIGQDEAAGAIDELPGTSGFEVVRIGRAKRKSR